MNYRLFLFLMVLVITIIMGVIAILFIAGTFTAGLSESERMLENELQHAAQGMTRQYGDVSMQTLEFAGGLSQDIEKNTLQLGIPLSALPDHPEILEKIIAAELDRTLFALQLSKSSGAFFILDATVNPSLENAQNSRAGLYIKNMEPNVISSFSPNVTILRGFPDIGRKNSLCLHAQWQMEFDVNQAPYFHFPVEAARNNPTSPLSRLYYWSPALKLPDSSEEVMLCTVPLIDSGGSVFGVGGIEISSMLFKMTHMPNNNIYHRLFCALSPMDGTTLRFHQSMLAGGFSARAASKGKDTLEISKNRRAFFSYKRDADSSFLGVHMPVSLYPEDSAFNNEHWAVAVMVPEADIVSSITKLNLLLIGLLMLLVILGSAASFFLSRTFIKPITEGLDMIKSADLNAVPRTRIAEIDDLIDYVAQHNQELYEKARQENLSLSILDEFLENIKKLSPAERAVFDLYVRGNNAKEAAEALCLSINTIKTHNKRIYTKLNVASRDELQLYISMLHEIGAEIN